MAINGVMLVSPQGNDSNDGTSWLSSKSTIYGAAIALPGGSANPPTAGSGIICFLDGSAASPVSGAGVWLMGTNDPNYSAPPSGWLRFQNSSLSIIGIGDQNYGPNPHIPRAAVVGGLGSDNTHPGVWISGTASPLFFENVAIQYPGRAYVIGVDSNNNITGTSGVASVTFSNCTGNVSKGTGLGPTWTIGGESFWVELIDCGGSGSIGTNGHLPTDDTAQAFLIDGRGSSGGQIINFRGYTNLGQGGIKFYGGSNDISQVSIEDAMEEGAFGATAPVSPVYWAASGGHGNIVRIGSAAIADGGTATMPAVQNDGDVSIFVTNAWGVLLNTQGSMVSTAEYANNIQNQTISPLRQNQAGFFAGSGNTFPNRVVGLKDDARRNFIGLSRFQNIALQQTSSWTAVSGATLVQGIAAPDGTNNAGRVSNANTFSWGVAFSATLQPTIAFAVGDWVLIGCWARSNSGNGLTQFPVVCNLQTAGYAFAGPSPGQIQGGSWIQGDGEWQWVSTIGKIATVGTGGCATRFMGVTDSSHTLDFYAPVVFHIPTGTISDNEVYEIFHSLVSVRDDAPVATVSVPRGQALLADKITTPSLVLSGATATTATAGTATLPANPLGFIEVTVGSTVVKVPYYTV